MEVLQLSNSVETIHENSTTKPFIMANTTDISLKEIREHHIIPVFVKDNEPVISHADFIDTAVDVVQHVFQGEAILSPSIRISHPIKGRIPEAKHKPATCLLKLKRPFIMSVWHS